MLEFKEILKELRRPFPAEEAQYKIQTIGQKAALVVVYVDARAVSERFNEIIPESWSNSFEEVKDGILCNISISLEDGKRLIRSDVGSFDNVNEAFGGMKGAYSDAFKRAAVHFGVGVSLYSHPTTFIPKNKLRQDKHITDEIIDELREKNYVPFLKSIEKDFGEAL